jgi:hypothetical protein
MKSTLTLYRILSYILIIIAAILGIAALFALLIALANPILLLSVFMLAAVVMYSFSSFIFFTNGIDGKQNQKTKRRDFIKANAYVAIVFAFLNIFQSVSLIANPALLNEAINQFSATQASASPLPLGLMVTVIKAATWFLLFYGIALIIHIQITFKLLKQYHHLFENGDHESNTTPKKFH